MRAVSAALPLAESAAYPAPAKLNLFLHVLGRRDDGYHELQTAFQFLDFGDELRFELRGDERIRRVGGLPGVAQDEDLVVRAAHLLRARGRDLPGVDIHLRKRIPPGSGLGGGSSDAATTLVVMNRLWGLGLPSAALCEAALELGADVPVFVHGHAAFAEGVGERLTDVEVPEPHYLVLVPDLAVSTAAIFADPALTRHTPPTRISDFLDGRGRFGNDCEAVVRRRHPPVARALDWLGERAEARLSGTGASVFAAFDSRAAARAVAEEAPRGWTVIVARGNNISPLRTDLMGVADGA